MTDYPLQKANFLDFTPIQRQICMHAVNPMCPLNDGIEDMEHLLLCPSFDAHRRDLLAGVFHVLRPFLSSLPP